jgi:hypothetical protein
MMLVSCLFLSLLRPSISFGTDSSPSSDSGNAASDGTPAEIRPLNDGFEGGWGYSLLSAEEQSREPDSNKKLIDACTKDDPLVPSMEAAAKTFESYYDFTRSLDPMGQFIKPEWEECMGPAENAEQWKKKVKDFCLGPLSDLIGIWVGDAGKSYSAVPSYSLGSNEEVTFLEDGVGLIPGQPQATFHAIKNQTYKELIQFTPILGNVKNRGYSNGDAINPECQANQVNQGLKYVLTVVQTSPSDDDGEYGGVLHDETGMIMYNSFPASGGGELEDFKLFRMATVPHGVSFTATGSHAQEVTGADAKDKLIAEQEATYMNIRALPQTCVPADDYDTTLVPWGMQEDGNPQPGVAPYDDLTPFLVNQTEALQEVKSYTHFVMGAQETSQTEFLKQQANTVDVKYDMWLSNVVGDDGKEYEQLQYTQFSKFIFQQRFDCLICEGAKVPRDADGCYTSCEEMDQEFTNPTGSATYAAFEGKTLNEIPAMQHGQCYNCKPDPACEKQRGGGKMFWPHIQVNTLRKVTDDTDPEILKLYEGIDIMGSWGAHHSRRRN